MIKNIIKAKDGSINYIINHAKAKNIIECRYVRREPSYISTYVSSHNGCKMGCTFCWLTQSGQTDFSHVTIPEYVNQLDTILKGVPDNHKQLADTKNVRVNVNFMARGEAMANKYVVNNYADLYDSLYNTVQNNGYNKMKMNVSSIYPATIKGKKLEDIFANRPVNFYYSIYSCNHKFRKEIIPNAMPVKDALDGLKSLQENHHDNTVVFHCAYIKSGNDNIKEVNELADLIKSYKFTKTKFNLVRLNPYIKNGLPIMEETPPEKLKDIFEIMNNAVTNKVETYTHTSRIINRVGSDAFVSCGMFANTDVDMDIYERAIND